MEDQVHGRNARYGGIPVRGTPEKREQAKLRMRDLRARRRRQLEEAPERQNPQRREPVKRKKRRLQQSNVNDSDNSIETRSEPEENPISAIQIIAANMRRQMLRRDDDEFGGNVPHPGPPTPWGGHPQAQGCSTPNAAKSDAVHSKTLAVTIAADDDIPALSDHPRLAIESSMEQNSDNSIPPRYELDSEETSESDIGVPIGTATERVEEDYKDPVGIAEKLQSFMGSLRGKHSVSWSAQKAIYGFLKENGAEIGKAAVQGRMPHYKTVRRNLEKSLPKTCLRIKYLDEENQECVLNEVQSVPKWLAGERD